MITIAIITKYLSIPSMILMETVLENLMGVTQKLDYIQELGDLMVSG